jgi:hypothetical protein
MNEKEPKETKEDLPKAVRDYFSRLGKRNLGKTRHYSREEIELRKGRMARARAIRLERIAAAKEAARNPEVEKAIERLKELAGGAAPVAALVVWLGWNVLMGMGL